MKTPERFEDLTPEYVFHVMDAARKGKATEISSWRTDCWSKCKPCWQWHEFRYRVAPEPPKKRLRPWMHNEVPLLLAIQLESDKRERAVITQVRPTHVLVGAEVCCKYRDLLDQWERADGSPCGVEEEVEE